MKIVTHNGYFHADDLFSVAVLLLKYPSAEVVRSRDPEIIAEGDLVVDVGQIYDPSSKRFDHHQRGGAGVRQNGIPYSSFGLVWKEYGSELCQSDEVASILEEKIIMGIDAEDCGFDLLHSVVDGVDVYNLASYLDSFNNGAVSIADFDNNFKEALRVAQDVITREISIAKRKVSDWEKVRRLYEDSVDKRIIVLSENVSWKKVLIPLESLYVIFPRVDGEWSARAIPKFPDSFETKKPFPESWAGLTKEKLAEVSGVPEATFCHDGLWIANAKTKEGAIRLAEKALNA